MDEKMLVAKREAVRKALDEYEGALEEAMDQRITDYDHLMTSHIQVQSARRVLWMEVD